MMCLNDRSTSTGALSDRYTSTGALNDRSTSTGALSDRSTSTGALSDCSTSTGALNDRSTSTGTLSDRSTFTSTDVRVTDLGHYFFLEDLLSSRGVCVCKSSSSLPPLSFHGIRAWCRLRAEQQAQEAKEAV